MASESFLRRNPRYREAEWKSHGPREKRPNVRVSNLDTFYAKQAGASSERGSGGEAFEGDSSAEGVARRLAETGRRTGFGGVGIEPNRNLSPRERLNLKTESRTETRAPAGPTDDQRKWAKSFRDSQPQKSAAPTVQDKAGFNPMSPGAEDVPANTSTTAPEKPLNFSRSALVEGAKKSGDFAEIRKGFNTQSKQAGTGMRMNDRGGMVALDKKTAGADGLTPYAREKFGAAVEDKAAQRDFATGKSTTTTGLTGMDPFTNSGDRPTQASDFRREITSKYGTGSNVTRTPGQGGGTMVDPLTGKSVPTTGALADQSAVQTTKEPGSKTGDDYFDPKKFRQNRGRSA